MAEEWMVRVDPFDKPLDRVARRLFPFGDHIHRTTFIFVLDSQDRLCVQTRSLEKGYCPGLRDLAAGGVVGWQESYFDCARRELAEELGVEAPLQLLGKFLHRSAGNHSFGVAYGCRFDGPIRPQDMEVTDFVWLPLDQVLQSPGPAFTPDSLDAFHRFKGFIPYL
ncbi:NUDIX domain-containing protein [Gallaecimonas kandeliae]|uniref:NUDIX hydrolase n=1 Tax=Gallaecimonas kandeliae TaxID=3029055 RepID=UPI0026490A35|nr:NUDIX domain-containing protein [Gallaecimonas kandeliae]WKE65216.1 NUDIX domain-containing protein [Gallaecimonas kandeliae]